MTTISSTCTKRLYNWPHLIHLPTAWSSMLRSQEPPLNQALPQPSPLSTRPSFGQVLSWICHPSTQSQRRSILATPSYPSLPRVLAMITTSRIIANKFMRGSTSTKSMVPTEKIPIQRISGDKILTIHQNPLLRLEEATFLVISRYPA